MFSILLLCGSLSAIASSSLGAEDSESDGTQKRFVYTHQGREAQPPLIFPVPQAGDLGAVPRAVDIDPVELDYPVKMVQRFTDSDGNVQVVTSYSNRKDNDQPIYRSRPAPQYQPEAYNRAPKSRSSAIEVEARSAPKKQQMSRTKTIRFPDANGQIVDHEEKTSFRDGNSKSFRTESSYDNSYKKPTRVVSSRPPQPERSAKYAPESQYDDDEYSSAEPEVEDEVAVRSALKQVNKKDVNVPSGSVVKPVRRAPSQTRFRSAKPSPPQNNEGPIRSAAKADHALEPAGSTYVADIEEIESDEDGYDRSDGYDENHGGLDIHVENHGVLGHGHGGLDHGLHHHGHGHGVDKGFKKEGGQSYNHGEHFAKGEKGGKGHKSKESYEKGHVEKHGHEHNKGGKKVEEGEKKGHIDEHNAYHKGHSHHKGEKGTEKAHTKGHKKGHKTKGFRTVHHKDEYKKDEVFYDEEHDAGHEKKHGSEHGGHQEVKGDESKKGHLDSGYKDAVKGVEGEKKEGHSYEESKGHAGEAAHKAKEGHQEGFHKGAGHKGEEAHGHVHETKGKGGW